MIYMYDENSPIREYTEPVHSEAGKVIEGTFYNICWQNKEEGIKR